MKSPVQMATYPATAHRAAHAPCATAPSNCRGRTEATIVPTAAAAQPQMICRAKGALARLAARLTSRIQSRSMDEPPRANTDPLPRHPATAGLTALEILQRPSIRTFRKRLTLTQQSDVLVLDASFSRSLVGFRMTGDVDASGPWHDLRAGGCH